jgi:squalene monooxygenase
MASTVNYEYDVIIVGAGIAGASLAHALGNIGYRTLLLERDLTEPGKSLIN